MMNLAEYRRAPEPCRLPALVALVQRGVILNKDGSFQRTARFRGPISTRPRAAELVSITSRLNNALRRLGQAGPSCRSPARAGQPLPGQPVPDPASGLVDDERRAQFEEEGAHFDSRYS